MFKYIFFDLDGTLTDSSEGITKCAKLALEHFGINGYELSDLTSFIGPPLRDSFPKYGVPADKVEEAIEVFRGRYNVVGKFENKPYEGIPELLNMLMTNGFRLFVATSKPEITAKQIMDKFDLTKYFEVVCGATMDGSRDSKESVIRYLLDTINAESAGELSKEDILKSVIMIGDTEFDVVGAMAFGINTIGVSWGFGSAEDMLNAGAISIVDTMDDLYKKISE